MQWVSAITEQGFSWQWSRLYPGGLVGWVRAGIGSTGMALVCDICLGSCTLHPHAMHRPLCLEGVSSPVMVLQGSTESPGGAEGYVLHVRVLWDTFKAPGLNTFPG